MSGRYRFRRLIVTAVIVVCFFVLMPTARTRGLRALGSILVVDQHLERADIIVVPDWTEDSGPLEAADLVHAGFAARVAVLVGQADPVSVELARRGVISSTESWRTRLVRALGVARVEEIVAAADGTDAEGPILVAWLTQHGFRTAIVVSTADHSRRLRRILDRALKNQQTTVIVRVARFSTFQPDSWWQTRSGWRTAVVELEKLAFDMVQHPVPRF
jgi:hypothetical protein